MSRAQLTIWADVGDERREAGRCGRSHDALLLGKNPGQLNPNVQADTPIPVHGHIAASLQIVAAGKREGAPTAIAYRSAEVGPRYLTPYNGKRHTLELGKADIVGRHKVLVSG